MRYLLILFLGACSYNPLVDMRASGSKAQYLQRDIMECREIMKPISKIQWLPRHHKVMNKCLSGRGHSVLSILGE